MTVILFPEGLRECVEPLDEGGHDGRRREANHGVQVGSGLRLAELRPQSPPHGVHLRRRTTRKDEARFNRPFDPLRKEPLEKRAFDPVRIAGVLGVSTRRDAINSLLTYKKGQKLRIIVTGGPDRPQSPSHK